MSIWHASPTVEQLNQEFTMPIAQHFGITFTAIGDDFLEASMPVTSKVHQPFGIMHGGISCVLSETVASVAGTLCIDHNKFYCVGLEINANHVKPVSTGTVKATATALHIGRRTHLWDVKLRNDQGQLICVSRLTLMVNPIESH